MNTAGLYLLTDTVARHTSRHHGAAVFDTSGWSPDHPGWDDTVTAGFLACEEQGLIETATLDAGFSSVIAYRVTEAGRRLLSTLSPAALIEPLGDSPSGQLPSTGDRALWLWLLRHGGTLGFMANDPDTDGGNILHVRACGLDWDRSGAVSDEAWTTKAGTFAEQVGHHGVRGEAVCRCGLVGGERKTPLRRGARHTTRPGDGGPLEVYAEVSGLVALLRDLL